MTRVLFVGTTSPIETFLSRLAKGLLARGFEIGIASTARDTLPQEVRFLKRHSASRSKLRRMLDTSKDALAASTSPLVASRVVKHAFRQGSLKDIAAALHRDLHLVKGRWDVLYVPWNNTAIAQEVIFDLGHPVVISCRGSQVNVAPHNPKAITTAKALARSFKRAAAVHCVSEDIATAAQRYGLDRKKTTVIRPAVDADWFRPPREHQTRPLGGLKLISVGSLIWRKGHTDTLLALAILKRKGLNCRLQIVGSGSRSEQARMHFEAEDLGVRDLVDFQGELPPEQILKQLQQSDLFVLASLSEGISNAALEAMACGLPVVSTDAGGMHEAIEDGVNGVLVPRRAPQKLAEAIEIIALNPSFAKELGERARATILSRFTLDQQVAQFGHLFEDLSSRKSQPHSVLSNERYGS